MIWALIFLIGLLMTKYYTENALRGLRVKTRENQKRLSDVKHLLTTAQEELEETDKEEKSLKARLERLQAIITDMEVEINESAVQARKGLSVGTETEEEKTEGQRTGHPP